MSEPTSLADLLMASASERDRFLEIVEILPTAVSSCGLIRDATGRPVDYTYLYGNAAFFAETGFSREIIGRPVREALPGLLEGAPQVLEWLARVITTGKPERIEIWLPTMSTWFNLAAYRADPGIAVCFAETMLQRENQARLVKLQERLSLAQTVSRSGVWDWDMLTGEIYWTDEFIRLLGLDPALARPSIDAWSALLHPEDRQAAMETLEHAARLKSRLSSIYRIVRPSGDIRWLQAEGDTICDARGTPVRMLGICVDITDALENARRAATMEAASEAKSSFLGTISHEIRTPLNSIVGFSKLLLDGMAGELNAEQRKQLGIVHAAGTDLAALVSDVLDFAKLEAGKLAIAPRPFELRDLLRHEMGLMALQAEQHGIELSFEVKARLDVFADPVRVAQVVRNFLTNAIKFTDHGRVLVRALQQSDGLVRVEVEDSGIGIDEVDRARLFEPYQRAANPDAARRTGTGLGLSISRALVVAMGGEIGVRSELGLGSCFWFTVPAAP